MVKYYLTALLFMLSIDARAEIVEKPLKLENQSPQDPQMPQQADANGAIVFPPATEPYKPVDRVTAPQPAYHSQPIQQPAYQPPQVVQQPYNTPAPSYGAGGITSREVLERAADNCEAELADLWRQKTSIDPSRRAQFQKCMGEAKVRCDQLKEASQAFKKADQQLSTYQYNLQQAKSSLY